MEGPVAFKLKRKRMQKKKQNKEIIRCEVLQQIMLLQT